MNSKSPSPHLSIYNYREQLQTLKKPYLQEVRQTAQNFHQKVVQSQKKKSIIEYKKGCLKNQLQGSIYSSQSQVEYLQKKYNLQTKQKQIPQFNDQHKKLSPAVKPWKPNILSSFEDHEQMLKNYHDIFQNKQKIKKNRKSQKIEDFRIDQWKMVNQIYEQLKEHHEESVKFQVIIQFFEQCQLFYYFYNIHPHRLPNMLQQFSKKFEDKLTKEQFFDFFLIDRPPLDEYNFKTERIVHSNCVLSEEAWKDLKTIFDTLDTFGNQEINMKNWIQKIKANPSNLHLLQTNAIHFPEIQRYYNLRKIIFALQNKVKFSKKVQWSQIQDLIYKFTHIEEPSIQQIWATKIAKGEISKDTNSFILDEKAINQIKNIFRQCPKYCDRFVKSSLFAIQLLQSNTIKKSLKIPIRLANSTNDQYLDQQNNDKCATCSLQDLGKCTSCMTGYALNKDNACQSCSEGCINCESSEFCLKCDDGYYLQLKQQRSLGICSLCSSEHFCETCQDSANKCKSCREGYSLTGKFCRSNNYLQIQFVFLTPISEFTAKVHKFKIQLLKILGKYFEGKTFLIIMKEATSGSTHLSADISIPQNADFQQTYQILSNSLNRGQRIGDLQLAESASISRNIVNQDDDTQSPAEIQNNTDSIDVRPKYIRHQIQFIVISNKRISNNSQDSFQDYLFLQEQFIWQH